MTNAYTSSFDMDNKIYLNKYEKYQQEKLINLFFKLAY